MPKKKERRNLLNAILIGIASTVVLVGIADLTDFHDAQYPRGLGDLVAGLGVGLIVWYLGRIHRLECDGLTGLLRRIAAEEKLARSASRRRDITVGVIDVNGLKGVNDTQGHDAGDELLRELSSRLAAYARRHPKNLVARLGGDEFIIIAPKTGTRALADRLDALIAPVHEFGSWPIAVAGVARSRIGSRDVLRCADLAMYRAKHVFYDTGNGVVLQYNVELDGVPEPPRVLGPDRRRNRIATHKVVKVEVGCPVKAGADAAAA